MFNTKKVDAPPSTSPSKPSLGSIAYPPPAQAPVQDRNPPDRNKPLHSIVDECLTMKGDLESAGDILVKGKVIGNIKCKLLIVDTDASVEGGVVAEEVVIRGRTKGTVRANRVKLEKTAIVDSEICHQTFAAEEGARVKGALKFSDEPLTAQSEGYEAQAA
jgi:cytoskeletal protein CcmA (bactofilin family)